MRRWVVLMGIFGFCIQVMGQEYGPVMGSMTGAGLAGTSFWSIFGNPAAIGKIINTESGYAVTRNYLLEALTQQQAALILPTKPGVIGLSVQSRGNQLLHNDKVGLALARNFGRKITFGMQLDYLSTRFAEGYGSNQSFTFEAGLLCDISKVAKLAIVVDNPLSVKRTQYQVDNYPSYLKVGLSYLVVTKLTWFVDVVECSGIRPIFKTGFEYRYEEHFQFRIGISGQPLTMAFGGSLSFGKMIFDFSSSWHPVLGISPGVGISYILQKK